MSTYLNAEAARDHIRSRGVPIGNKALKDHQARGTGPKSAIINGRRLYTREWLDAWIEEQAARPAVTRRGPRPRRDAKSTTQSAA